MKMKLSVLIIFFILVVSISINTGANVKDNRNLAKLQEDFLNLKFGMFIHFNMATFAGKGWSTGREDPAIFNPSNLDCAQWADAAVSAHMKYAVLTVKHTGGWCLWDSDYTEHDITMFENYKNGKGDIVKEFCDAFRKHGLKVGFYYCFPLANNRWAGYWTLPLKDYEKGTTDSVTFIKNQFKELLTGYGDISVIWVDQSISKNGGMKPGDWESIKAYIHSIQPNCLVLANNQVNYSKTDIYGYEYSYSLKLPPENNKIPSEVCDKIHVGGWFSSSPDQDVKSLDYILNRMLLPIVNNKSTFLLNCAPYQSGLLSDKVVNRLKEIGKAWDPNKKYKNPGKYNHINNVIYEIPNSQNRVALTFEGELDRDFLEKIVPVLDKYKAKATFFIKGDNIKQYSSQIKNLVDHGHEIALDMNVNKLQKLKNVRDVTKAIKTSQTMIRQVTKIYPSSFRFRNLTDNSLLWDPLNYLDMIPYDPSVTVGSGNATDNPVDHVKKQFNKIQSGSIILIQIADKNFIIIEPLIQELNNKNFKIVTVEKLKK